MALDFTAATPPDAELLALMNRDILVETGRAHVADFAPILAGVTAALADPNQHRYTLIRDGRQLVGSYKLTCLFDDLRSQVTALLEHVLITPVHRGRGYFNEIQAHMAAQCRQLGIRKAALHVVATNPARFVYRKCGWDPTGEWLTIAIP